MANCLYERCRVRTIRNVNFVDSRCPAIWSEDLAHRDVRTRTGSYRTPFRMAKPLFRHRYPNGRLLVATADDRCACRGPLQRSTGWQRSSRLCGPAGAHDLLRKGSSFECWTPVARSGNVVHGVFLHTGDRGLTAVFPSAHRRCGRYVWRRSRPVSLGPATQVSALA